MSKAKSVYTKVKSVLEKASKNDLSKTKASFLDFFKKKKKKYDANFWNKKLKDTKQVCFEWYKKAEVKTKEMTEKLLKKDEPEKMLDQMETLLKKLRNSLK